MTTADEKLANPLPAPQGLCPQCGQPLGNARDNAVPHGVSGWSWGAFFLNVIWAIANRTWLGLLMFVPYLWFVMPFVLGYKGREWAWQNRRWESVEQFNRAQRDWSIAGVVAACVVIVVAILAGPQYDDYAVEARLSKVLSTLDPIKYALAQAYQENGCVPAMHTIVTVANQGQPATKDWATLGFSVMPNLPREIKRLEFSAQETPEIVVELDQIDKEVNGTTLRVKMIAAGNGLSWQSELTSGNQRAQHYIQRHASPAPDGPAPVRIARCR